MTWIKHFQALVAAGLSDYQAERVVRAASTVERHNEPTHTILLCGCVWAQMPGPGFDYYDAYQRLTAC